MAFITQESLQLQNFSPTKRNKILAKWEQGNIISSFIHLLSIAIIVIYSLFSCLGRPVLNNKNFLIFFNSVLLFVFFQIWRHAKTHWLCYTWYVVQTRWKKRLSLILKYKQYQNLRQKDCVSVYDLFFRQPQDLFHTWHSGSNPGDDTDPWRGTEKSHHSHFLWHDHLWTCTFRKLSQGNTSIQKCVNTYR